MKHAEVPPKVSNIPENILEVPTIPEAANDNSKGLDVLETGIAEAANDNLSGFEMKEAAQLAEVKERLGISEELVASEPTPEGSAEVVRVENIEKNTSAKAGELAAAASGGNTSGSGGGEKGGTFSAGPGISAAKAGDGKLFKALKGFGKLLLYIIGTPLALAFKGMHWSTGKIMGMAGAKVEGKK